MRGRREYPPGGRWRSCWLFIRAKFGRSNFLEIDLECDCPSRKNCILQREREEEKKIGRWVSIRSCRSRKELQDFHCNSHCKRSSSSFGEQSRYAGGISTFDLIQVWGRGRVMLSIPISNWLVLSVDAKESAKYKWSLSLESLWNFTERN